MNTQHKTCHVEPLAHHPAHIPLCATWAWKEWYTRRNIDYPIVLADYTRRAQTKRLPITLVAARDGNICGMISLKERELNNFEKCSPWISALYVAPGHRRQGIGSQLFRAALALASIRGNRNIYLFYASGNTGLTDFYQRMGCRAFQNGLDNDGKPACIMLCRAL
jgi:GNAT superfamily N-acetyltransferase